jgi:hypothetical protein
VRVQGVQLEEVALAPSLAPAVGRAQTRNAASNTTLLGEYGDLWTLVSKGLCLLLQGATVKTMIPKTPCHNCLLEGGQPGHGNPRRPLLQMPPCHPQCPVDRSGRPGRSDGPREALGKHVVRGLTKPQQTISAAETLIRAWHSRRPPRFLDRPAAGLPVPSRPTPRRSAAARSPARGATPVEQRAEAAVSAWTRQRTTAYDSMAVPRIKGKQREARSGGCTATPWEGLVIVNLSS